jgi:hypothetical protein
MSPFHLVGGGGGFWGHLQDFYDKCLIKTNLYTGYEECAGTLYSLFYTGVCRCKCVLHTDLKVV